MTLTIRDAEAKDHEQIGQIASAATQLLRRIYRPNPRKVEERRASRPALTQRVALSAGCPVGVVSYYFEDSKLHVLRLFVDPTCHRQGIGRALIGDLCEIGRKLGAARLCLHTVRETGNVLIFERLGFIVVSEQLDDSCESVAGKTVTDVYMERPIAESTVVTGLPMAEP
jgi:ribosomal protein S18 acetylase RimI-like enzyme